MDGSLPIGRVMGFRGRSGEVTVRVASGQAARWTNVRRVVLDERGSEDVYVESARSYGDRLVLKLRGVDDAEAAAALRGRLVRAPAEEVPALPRGTHYVERLVGLEVTEEGGRRLGAVTDVLESGGAAVLVVESEGGEEILIPMATEMVIEVRESEGRVTVRLPEGLRDLNAPGKHA